MFRTDYSAHFRHFCSFLLNLLTRFNGLLPGFLPFRHFLTLMTVLLFPVFLTRSSLINGLLPGFLPGLLLTLTDFYDEKWLFLSQSSTIC